MSRRQASIVKHITEICRYDDASVLFDSRIEVEFCVRRQLRDGTLEENGLLDGSRVILLPSVETGLLVSRVTPSCVETPQVPPDNHVFHNYGKLINTHYLS